MSPPSGRSVRDKRAKRREQVLEAAVGMFAANGYHDVSVDELATAAKISKPGLYAYFDSKEQLYGAVLERAFEELGVRIREAVSKGGSPEERMWGGIQALLDFVESHRDAWHVLTREAVAAGPVDAGLARSRSRLSEVIATLFAGVVGESGLGEGPQQAAAPLAYAFTGAAEAIARWWADHPEVPRGSVAMYLMNVAWQGLGNLLEGRLWMPPAGPAAG